tara:strand:+ start:43 stop:1827 length:1785 start_codon:yes stop_codon:yes gene_type:complete
MNEEDNLSEEGLEDPYEKELREAQEQANQRNEEGFRDLTEGKIRRKRTGEEDNEEFEQLEIPFESRNLGRVGAGLAFEVGFNSLLDALTAVPGSQQVGSAVINAIAQGIRGGKFSFGEVLGAAAASQIPGLAQGKAITKAGRIMRAAGTGATAGAIEATSIAAVDRGELPTMQEFGLAVGAGGLLGAGFQPVGEGASSLLKSIRRRVKGSKEKFVKLTREQVLELGLEAPMASRFADELSPSSAANLQNELDTRAVAGGYGFTYQKVATKNRRNRFGIPDDVSSVYLNHAEAYKKAMGQDDTLERFPTLIWNNRRYRPKSKGDYVYFEDYLDRQIRKKLGNDRRAVRIWKQTRPGVRPGTFYREKLKQLRALNTYEASLGIPKEQRTRLRDADMDHKNALRSVEIYTEGLSEDNTKLVYDLLERYDLFTGDDARNLILRNRTIHRLLWPKMKAALKALNHKTIADFQNTKFPELEYLKYLGVDKNPRTGSTPLREYVETIKFIEEQAGDEALAALKQKVINLYQGKQANLQTPLRDRLAEILGGEENLVAFIERLKREVPENIQPDLIEGEFNYIGSFGPLDPDEIADILNPPS